MNYSRITNTDFIDCTVSASFGIYIDGNGVKWKVVGYANLQPFFDPSERLPQPVWFDKVMRKGDGFKRALDSMIDRGVLNAE